jgi:hypothetical protein
MFKQDLLISRTNLNLGGPSIRSKRRFLFLILAMVCVMMTASHALAQGHVYWGGSKLWQADLSSNSWSALWNVTSNGGVAVDTSMGRIYWGDNSTTPAKIMWGNINGTGTPNVLLTVPSGTGGPGRIHSLEIDVGQQMIYWTDGTQLHIYRSSISSPSPQLLPIGPPAIGTLRDIALDTRASNQKLYILTTTHVYRSNLNGTGLQQLPNTLGNGPFFGLAIDTCTDQLFAIGESGGNPYYSIIVRADLANAGNLTTILQDPVWPPSNIGQHTRDIALDLPGGMMYWIADEDVNNLPTLRRATLSGTNVQVIAQGAGGARIALDAANTPCSTVGINKDLQNNTGQIANNIEILIEGTPTIVNHYDGYPANVFSSFTATPAPGGNTMLAWTSPNNDVQPGQIAHVGFNLAGTSLNILGVFWTRDDTTTGCASQVSTNTHLWGSPGSQVVYANNCLSCKSVPRYVGELRVEWHARHVPLADLNPRVRRNPIRTDVIRRAPIRLMPEAIARVDVPAAPRNALFGVIVHKVSTNPRLSGPDVTTDFLEFPVQRKRARSGLGAGTVEPARQ